MLPLGWQSIPAVTSDKALFFISPPTDHKQDKTIQCCCLHFHHFRPFWLSRKKIPITSMSLIPKIYSGIKGTRTVKFEVFFKIKTLNLVPVPKGIKHRLYINNGQRHWHLWTYILMIWVDLITITAPMIIIGRHNNRKTATPVLYSVCLPLGKRTF